ncbi:hypothetical protein TH63_09745 [Rufibacter radiotolerans]|uniref:Uncharacterized protein n=1 Tax=Rufibacter radiotolerans TaxID=1379910 RepID=A0A0H4VJ66_9BACT|nr:hypothetical protein [Rufibacter radiotolerans]AKQ45860.1 hypothetical protein TH63_09745 [Rufibacter radiotolerans]
MKTFQLKTGTLRIENDTILIEGDKARFLKVVYGVAAICWGLFFVFQGYLHYANYRITQKPVHAVFLAGSLLAIAFWVWVGYALAMKSSGLNKIPLQQISRAQKVFRPTKDAPLITLHLKDNRKRTLEFDKLDDLHFADSLAGWGVPITE